MQPEEGRQYPDLTRIYIPATEATWHLCSEAVPVRLLPAGDALLVRSCVHPILDIMTKQVLKRTGFGAAKGVGLLVGGAVVAAVLSACGGGDGNGAPDSPGKVADSSTDVRAKVLVVRGSGGFVEHALTASLRAADGADYDILVIGGGTPLDPALKAQAASALEGGKGVVLDAAADGTNLAVGANLKTLDVGISSIDADAVLVTKATDGGYDIAPIESPKRASARMMAMGTQSTAGINTVANVFGINAGDAQ